MNEGWIRKIIEVKDELNRERIKSEKRINENKD